MNNEIKLDNPIKTEKPFPKLMHRSGRTEPVWLVTSINKDTGKGTAAFFEGNSVSVVTELYMDGLVDFDGTVTLKNEA